MRSWRVQKTTPYTRVDVATGDLSTNSYRGFFGRRFGNGAALQIGAQQYSTQDPRVGGDGDLLGLLGRFGWAKKQWSADATLLRTRRSRTEQLREEEFEGTNLPGLDAARTDAYVRVGYGDADGPLLAAAHCGNEPIRRDQRKDRGHHAHGSANPLRRRYERYDGIESPIHRHRRHSRARCVGERQRAADDCSAGCGFSRRRLASATIAGCCRWRRTPSSRCWTRRSAATYRCALTPLSFLAIGGSLGKTTAVEEGDRPPAMAYRGEVGLRVGRLWATGGVMSIDTTDVPAPIVYDTLYQPRLGRSAAHHVRHPSRADLEGSRAERRREQGTARESRTCPNTTFGVRCT